MSRERDRPEGRPGLVDEELADQAPAKAEAEGVELLGPDGLLSQVTKAALGDELTEHLGYDRHDPAGRGSGNSRNGTSVSVPGLGSGCCPDWAAARAAGHGFAGVTVACEPTGHRWRVLGQLAADRSMPFVCVQPMVSSWSRRAEDLTVDKTDDKDAVLIARLTAQLRCYVPEPVDETCARLRHLGVRRQQLLTEVGSQVQRVRDLLECVWPAALTVPGSRCGPGPGSLRWP